MLLFSVLFGVKQEDNGENNVRNPRKTPRVRDIPVQGVIFPS